MTKPLEKLVVMKERYLILANYDFLKAEIIAMVDMCGQQVLRRSFGEWVSELSIVASVDTIQRRVQELVDDGYMEVHDNVGRRPKGYTLTENFYKKVNSLELELLEGLVLEINKIPDMPKVPINSVVSQFAPSTVRKGGNLPSLGEDTVDRKGGKLLSLGEDKGGKLPSLREDTEAKKEHKGGKLPSLEEDTSELTSSSPITSNTNNKSTSIITSKSTSTESSSSTTKRIKDSKPIKRKDKLTCSRKSFYDYRHYEQFSESDWHKAKTEFIWPKRENSKTLLIGAYLLGRWRKHHLNEPLATGDYNKFLPLAKHMLDFFTFKNNDDEKAGFAAALEYIKEFLNTPPESYQGRANWSIQLCFSRESYRQWRNTPRTGKKINDTGEIIWTPEDAKELHENANTIVVNGRRYVLGPEDIKRYHGGWHPYEVSPGKLAWKASEPDSG